MKKYGLLFVVVFAILLCGCETKNVVEQKSKQQKSKEVSVIEKYGGLVPTYTEKAKWHYVAADYNIQGSLAGLERQNDYIVEGKLFGKPVQTSKYDETTEGEIPIPDVGKTYLQMKITKVHKGNLKVGDCIVVVQDFALLNKVTGVCVSGMIPMKTGENWVYFLNKQDNNSYNCIADATGRYPIPEKKYLEMTEKQLNDYMVNNAEKLGYVKEEGVPSHTYYYFIKKYYKHQSLNYGLKITSPGNKINISGKEVEINKAFIEEGEMYLDLKEAVKSKGKKKVKAFYIKRDGKKVEMYFTIDNKEAYLLPLGEVMDPDQIIKIMVGNVGFKLDN